MYVYLNQFYEATTVIPHGEILRQGGNLNLYVCFDKELTEDSSLTLRIKTKNYTGGPWLLQDGKERVFRKIKDSEITYDLIDGNNYYVYFHRCPINITEQPGKIDVTFTISDNNGNTIATSAVSLYVEKTIGYDIHNDNISEDEYKELQNQITTIDIKKIDVDKGILRKKISSDFTTKDENRLFINDSGDVFTVKNQNGELKPIIINLSLEETNKLLEENYQKKLEFDTIPTENSDKIVKSGSVYDAIDSIPYVEVSKDINNVLQSITVDNKKAILPTTELIVNYEVENGEKILRSISLNKDVYNVKNITIDNFISSISTNPVQNRVLYTELNEKVDKVSGKGLSTYDFDDVAKNKLNSLDEISQNHDKDVKNISAIVDENNGRIILLNNRVATVENKINNTYTKNEIDKKIGDVIVGENSSSALTVVDEIPETLDEKLIYKLKNKAVPNTGYVGEVYFDTTLSVSEVETLLQKLSYTIPSDYGMCNTILLTEGIDKLISIITNNGAYVIADGDMNLFWCNEAGALMFSQVAGVQVNAGWQTFVNPIVINSIVISESQGMPMGTQNELIKKIFYIPESKYFVYDKGIKEIEVKKDSIEVIIPPYFMEGDNPFEPNSVNPYIQSVLDKDYATEENIQYFSSILKNFSINYPQKYENCKLEITVPLEQGYVIVMLNSIQILKAVPSANVMVGASLITFGRKQIDRPSMFIGYGCEVDFESQYAEENNIPQLGQFRISITPEFYKEYLYDTEKSKLKDGVSFKFTFY